MRISLDRLTRTFLTLTKSNKINDVFVFVPLYNMQEFYIDSYKYTSISMYKYANCLRGFYLSVICFVPLATGHCQSISNKRELEKAVAEIGDWESLCENLGAPKAVISGLRSSSMQDGRKKSRCLEAYIDTDEACWEQVVEVVADNPFYNRKLARKIADKHGVHYSSREEL